MSKSSNFSFFLIFFILVLYNGWFNTNIFGVVITAIELIVVLYFILIKKYEKAVFWHFVFILTSFSYYNTGLDTNVSYSYAKLKLIGPVPFFAIISLILIVFPRNGVSLKKTLVELKELRQFLLMISYFLLSGFLLCIMGYIFSDYYHEGVLQFGSYVIYLYLSCYILIKHHTIGLMEKFVEIIPPLFASVLFSLLLLHLYMPRLADAPAISFFAPLAIPLLLYYKKCGFLLFTIACYIVNIFFFGDSSGKSLILLLLCVLIAIVLSFNKNNRKAFRLRTLIIRNTFIILLLIIPILVETIGTVYGGSSKLVSKLWQVDTLFRFFSFNSGLENVATSPYIRLASLANILNDDLNNVIYLLFGRGYGGFFTDSLQLFNGIDLSDGAFSDYSISKGRFYTGHDTMVVLPMLHGLLGCLIFAKVFFVYIKRGSSNALSLVVIPFLLFAFYFDSLLGISGVVFLYASGYRGKLV